jgi:eukaryotic-like serine/threonine-protein kinase
LAWYETKTQLTKDAMGVVFYAAPEQLERPSSREARLPTVDVFSFGQLMYFTLMGTDPTPYDLEANLRGLRRVVASWDVEKAATAYLSLYEQCTKRDYRLRVADFQIILDSLNIIRTSLRDAGQDAAILPEEFARELRFSLIGLAGRSDDQDNYFTTASGRTRIALRLGESWQAPGICELKVQVDMTPIVEAELQAQTHKKVRTIIRKRVDEVLSDYPNAKRTSGQRDKFGVSIDLFDIPSSYGGVRTAQPIISRVIHALERD